MQSAQACTGVDTHVATCEDIIEVGALICHLCQGLEYPGCSGHGLLTLPTVDIDDKSVLDAVLTTANLRMHAYGHAKPHRDWPFKKFPGGGPVPSQHCRVATDAPTRPRSLARPGARSAATARVRHPVLSFIGIARALACHLRLRALSLTLPSSAVSTTRRPR